ncbi:MAG: adenylosuccinate synthetase, partial [Methanosarcinales archaeon]|nr:adenylosuccinate synthetase [Methanosarcinales archaeon]
VDFARCTPAYEEVKGWTDDITGAKSYQALPQAVRDYVERIEALLGVKITIVSVGPGREQTVRRG